MRPKIHPMADDTFVLDTHAWIWIVEGKAEIADSPLLSRIETASENSEVHISSIPLWEVVMLESKGRISFTIPWKFSRRPGGWFCYPKKLSSTARQIA